MPAAKLRPVSPSTTTTPPVMYSQPWSPTPSTTAMAPELRTAKPLAGDTTEVAFALGRAVKHGVADDDRMLGHDLRVLRRADDDAAARQPLADIVVAVTDEVEGDAARQERAERLAGGASQRDSDRVVLQPAVAVALGDCARQHRTGRTVDVLDTDLEGDRCLGWQAPARPARSACGREYRRSGASAQSVQ